MYDRLMVPLIFEPYARDIVERVVRVRPRQVLETAAGTGVVTRLLASRLPADARIVATDLNPPMIEVAARQLQDDRIMWKQADALALPFEDLRFDAVVCQFGAMFFPDKTQGYREARRVLQPGGHFFFNVWDRIEANEIADVVTQTLAEVFPDDPPRFMARTPHGYYDVETIRAELHAAGFTEVAVEPVDAASRAPSPHQAALAYCQGTNLRSEIETRDASRLNEATERATEALVRRFGTGAVDGRIRAFVFTATR
jgi:ubiquinone/menaquinone biosynthesis C-methylase UbiE